VLGLGRGLGSVLSIFGYVVLTPVLTFYLLRDFDALKNRIADLLPASARAEIVEVAGEYDGLLARYLRGQVTVALLMGTITALGLLVLRFPYAILLGVLVTIFSVVPYLGLILSLVPALFIAVVSGQVLISLLKVAVVYGVSQGLEGAVISPRIVGDSVGLHPVWVVLALAVGGFYFGFVGLLIGVPAAVGVKLLVVRGVHRYRQSDLYLGASRNRE
jgi:predicted PurR-regulated permease PerM